MKCSEARKILWPADMPRIGDENVSRALEHAESCATCREFLERDRQVAELIHTSVPRARAPRELRERLFTAIARERAGTHSRPAGGSRRRSVGRWLAAGSLALVALAAGAITFAVLSDGGDSDPAAEVFAHDYLRRVVEQEEMRGTEQDISDFFARELGIGLQPPSIPGLEIERALICLLGGERGGVVEYVGSGMRLSYYMMPAGDEPLSEPSDVQVGESSGDRRVATAVDGVTGLTVATWRDGVHRHALVGNVDTEELRLLVGRYACPVTRG